MTTWQIVRIFAGCFIVLSLLLGVAASPLFVGPYWLLLAVFVALNLLQSGFTRWCLLETILRKLGVRAGN
jgi:uncharacterized membrane protein